MSAEILITIIKLKNQPIQWWWRYRLKRGRRSLITSYHPRSFGDFSIVATPYTPGGVWGKEYSLSFGTFQPCLGIGGGRKWNSALSPLYRVNSLSRTEILLLHDISRILACRGWFIYVREIFLSLNQNMNLMLQCLDNFRSWRAIYFFSTRFIFLCWWKNIT